MSDAFLELQQVTVRLPISGELRTVLHDVSFRIAPGEAVGLVGESGSGKSMTARAVARLLPPGAESSGTVRFAGDDVATLKGAALRAFRAEVAVVFQDPRAHINPVRTIGDFMTEALKDKPPTPFRVPPGVRLVRVDARTGKPAMPGEAKAIYEAFKGGDRMPGDEEDVLEGGTDVGFSFAPYLGAEEGAAPSGELIPPGGGKAAPAAAPQPTGPTPSAGGLY